MTETVGKPPARPNKEAFDREIGELNSKIDQLKAQSNGLKEKIAGSTEDKSKLAKQRKDIRDKIDALRLDQNAHNDVRQKVLDQLKQIQDAMKHKTEEIRKSKEKIPFKSTVEIERRIAELEARVSSGSMKLIEEKRALQDISALRKQMKLFENFDSQDTSLEVERKKVEDLRLKLDAFEPERKRLKQLIDEQFKALRALDADKEENAGASKNGIKLLIEQRETINAEINELIGKRRELFAENKRQNDVWYSYQREEKARKAEQYRLEKIQREKQKKLDSVKQARELAEMPAFETEINTCNALISVLRLLQRDSTGAAMKENNGSIVKAESVNSSSVDPNMALPKGVTATVALKKKSDRLEDEQYLFLGSKKKGSHKSSANPNKGLLKFDIAVVEQFLSLDLTMPAKHVDIADAVAALNAKKEFFFQNQERVTKENIQKAKELEEKVMKSITENEELNAAEPMGV